jgi:hypothetical protein
MTATPVAPLAGLVELTVGAVVSPPGATGLLSSELHPAIAIMNIAAVNAVKPTLRRYIGDPSCCGDGETGEC